MLQCFLKKWWIEKDLNLRRLKLPDLQSGRFTTHASILKTVVEKKFNSNNFTPSTHGRRAKISLLYVFN